MSDRALALVATLLTVSFTEQASSDESEAASESVLTTVAVLTTVGIFPNQGTDQSDDQSVDSSEAGDDEGGGDTEPPPAQGDPSSAWIRILFGLDEAADDLRAPDDQAPPGDELKDHAEPMQGPPDGDVTPKPTANRAPDQRQPGLIEGWRQVSATVARTIDEAIHVLWPEEAPSASPALAAVPAASIFNSLGDDRADPVHQDPEEAQSLPVAGFERAVPIAVSLVGATLLARTVHSHQGRWGRRDRRDRKSS